ncbi:MAG: sugar transferase [Eggerthellaceae bacterium]|nr:sugar transferase [Eggerthellaceae bacterium]
MTKGISIVGPRPALPLEVATYNARQKQRLQVELGITCYWQARRNRDSITFDEWVDLDL